MAWRLHQSLRSRLLWLVLLTLTPAIALHVASAIEKRHLAQTAAQNSLASLADLAAGQSQAIIYGGTDILRGLANLPDVISGDPNKSGFILRKGPDPVSPIRQPDPARPERPCRVLHHRRLAGYRRFRKFLVPAGPAKRMTSGSEAITRPLPTHRPDLLLAQPVREPSGEVVGLCVLGLRLDWFSRLFAGISFPDQTEARLLDTSGRILAAWPEEPRRIGQRMPDATDLPPQPRTDAHLIWTTPRPSGVSYCNIAVPVLVGGKPELILRLRRPLAAVLAPLDTAMKRDMALLALVLALALAAAHAFARFFILRPTGPVWPAWPRIWPQAISAAARASPQAATKSPIWPGALDTMGATLEERIRFTRKSSTSCPRRFSTGSGRSLSRRNRAYEQTLHPLSAILGKKSCDFAPPAQAELVRGARTGASWRTRARPAPTNVRSPFVMPPSMTVIIFKAVFAGPPRAPRPASWPW